jgi:hypothetical protein
MDITPQGTTQKSISDDQELAKALAGVLPDVPEPTPAPEASAAIPATEVPAPLVETPAQAVVAPGVPPLPEPTTAPVTPAGDLDGIKKNALEELRPLIDKVDLPAEEKFDTYLMLIRSTDDSSLIAPAFTSAQGITDEKRRAEALLDIVKEIDYLSKGSQPIA